MQLLRVLADLLLAVDSDVYKGHTDDFLVGFQTFTGLFSDHTSPAGSLLAVKLHSENGVIFKGKYEILISLILQWQDNPRKTRRNQLSLIIG